MKELCGGSLLLKVVFLQDVFFRQMAFLQWENIPDTVLQGPVLTLNKHIQK